jgi:hypothetical protein
MHTPTPDPREDEEEPDEKHPPVPPDQEPYVIPQREPPNPDESHPLIGCSWRRFDPEQRLAVHDSRVLGSSTSLGNR